MAETVRIRNTADAYVASSTPDKNYSGTQRLYVKMQNPDTRYAYLYYGMPFPLGSRILSAKLRLVNGTRIEGGRLRVQRIAQKWQRNQITYREDNRPTVGGPELQLYLGENVPAGTEWEVDVTTIMQSVADGAPWYGLRFTMNDGRGEWFHASASREVNSRPLLVVEWVDNPDEPVNLSPSGGNAVDLGKPLLSWDWTDDRGSTAINAVRVQVATTIDFTGNSLFDSGFVDSVVPELDLEATTFGGMLEGETWYWRCRVRDGSGVESPWSDPEAMKRVARVFPTMNNPLPGEVERTNLTTGVNGSLSRAFVDSNATLSLVDGAIRGTKGSAAGTFSVGWALSGTRAPATPGQIVTLSADLLSSAGGEARSYVRFYNSSGSTLATPQSDAIVLQAGVSKRAFQTVTAPAGSATMAYFFSFPTTPVGGYGQLKNVLLEIAGSDLGYFDGNSVGEFDGQYSFVGQSLESASTKSKRPFVEEGTPPILWAYAGVQKSWQVLITDPADSNRIVANSGKITSSATGWTIPASAKLEAGKLYEAIVRVWDNVRRERNKSATPFANVRRRFEVKFTSDQSPIADLQATNIQPFAWVRLSWTRATAPDRYEIYRNNKLVRSVESSEIDYANGRYAITIRKAPPRRDNVWRVVAIVNNRGVANSPSVTTNYKLLSFTVSETNGANPLVLLNYSMEQAEGRQQTVHQVVGEYPPVLITQAKGGEQGTVTGTLAGEAIPDVNIVEERNRWDKLTRGEGRDLLFSVLDDSFEGFLANPRLKKRSQGGQLMYDVSFDYYQTDF